MSAVLVVSLAGTASAAGTYPAAASYRTDRPCSSQVVDALVLTGSGALVGLGTGGPPGALGGAIGGLIVGGVKTAQCLGSS